MTPSLFDFLIGAIAFAVAFGLARFIGKRLQQRRREREEAFRAEGETRQVRRARGRRRR
ncbi:MAG: hypothetical protein NVS3B2_14380 [Ramlibacter sp.]